MKSKNIIIVILSMVLLTGCTVSKTNIQKPLNDDTRPIVYTSIYPLYDFAKKIGEEEIDIRQMVPPGIEPHDWEPSAKMMAELEGAHGIIYNGGDMEPWLDKILLSLEDKAYIVKTTKNMDLLPFQGHNHHEEDEGHYHGSFDPHVWLDPERAKQQAETIKDALVALDPENEDFYQSNYEMLSEDLDELDRKYQEELQNVQRKEIIVSHGAFGYLTNRYGLEQISIMGLSPQEEPSAAKLAEITEEVKVHGINTIFFETLTNPRLSLVLAKEVGAKTAVLHPLGGVTLEELEEGKDYFSIMEDNLQALVQALGE